MRSIYTLILVAVVVASCKKEAQQTAGAFFLSSIQREIKDSMRSDDFARLDFSRALYNHVDSAGLYFLRVPFRGTSITENFVLVKLNEGGSIQEGRIIRLNGGVYGVGDDEPVRAGEWEGEISISPLNRGGVLKSAVHKGYIEALHPHLNTREMLLGANVLPEVVLVAYVNRIEPMDISTWLRLMVYFFKTADQMAKFEWVIPLSTFILLCFFALSFLAYSVLLLNNAWFKRDYFLKTFY
jgi:hypothetical protein